MKYTLSNQYPNKRAFITGAGSGLGKELALALAQDQWTIGMADIAPEPLKQASEEVMQKGGKAITYILDVADKNQYQAVSQEFLNALGGIDLLFNNAGVGDGGYFEEYGLENWEWMVGINLMGVIYGCHFFIPTMKKQRAGHIINTASIAAVACAPLMSPYNTTKAGVVAISETLYMELKPSNIYVSVIQPAFFKTNITQYAKGGPALVEASKREMEKSKITAPQVAHEVLVKAGNKKMYIILPQVARTMRWIKRLFPMYFLNFVAKMASKQIPELHKS
jgi:short-subunit dehydrogenase